MRGEVVIPGQAGLIRYGVTELHCQRSGKFDHGGSLRSDPHYLSCTKCHLHLMPSHGPPAGGHNSLNRLDGVKFDAVFRDD